jgi:CubicO group peptidase (beta-lactamase class C family)
LVTTLTDFVRWSRLYLGHEQTILGEDSIERMTRAHHVTEIPGPTGQPHHYGYGLLVSGALVGHAGYIVGFRSDFLLDRQDGLLIVVFTNNTTNDPRRITGELYRLLN